MWLHFLICLILLGFATVKPSTEVNLKVSTKKEVLNGVSAGIHAFSQIELLNLDENERITIHSVSTTNEKIYVNGNLVQEPIPQQLHVSRVSTLTLEPGSGAIVPLTFLPRYPHDEHNMPKPSNSVEGEDSAPPLDSYQRADLTHLVGEEALEGRPYYSDFRRNNLEYKKLRTNRTLDQKYEVQTSVVIQTSRGTTAMPLVASSIRSNEYHVPERIRFTASSYREKIISSDATLLHSVDCGIIEKESTKWPSYDCYDVYIHNPRKTEPLQILEVLVSKPDAVSLFDINNDKNLQNGNSTFSEWGGNENWIPPNASKYVITVCPNKASNPLDSIEKISKVKDGSKIDFSKIDINLGYLQMKTEQDTLFVLLEWYLTTQEMNQDIDRSKRLSSKKQHLNRMKGKPSKLMTFVVPFTSPRQRMRLSVKNTADVPIKVMRASLFLRKGNAPILEKTKLQLQLKTKLDPSWDSDTKCIEEGSSCEETGIISAGSTWKDAFNLDIEAKSNLTLKYLRKNEGMTKITGVILVTGTTDINSKFDEWFHSMKQNPYNRKKIVLEIPWTIKMVNGRVYAVMEGSTSSNIQSHYEETSSSGVDEVGALFFPLRPFNDRNRTNRHDGVVKQTVESNNDDLKHTIRFVAFSHMPLNVTKVRLEANKGDPNSKICDRFEISSKGSQAMEPQEGLFDLGTIAIKYNFNQKGTDITESSIFPTICRLVYETRPVYTGKHFVSLLVFPGRLEITTTAEANDRMKIISDESTGDGQETLLTTSVRLGLKQVLTWFESTKVGSAMLDILQKHRKKGKTVRPLTLLREYFIKLVAATKDDFDVHNHQMEPILVNAEAITHGETLTVPLYFTNHNPIPIKAFLDVAEVEGMRISISRETSRLRGDGNSIIDYLPSSFDRHFDKLNDGVWATHSREGLKNFLTTNDYASQMLQSLAYRDAIDLSSRAIKLAPLLEVLHKKQAKAQFHADEHALNFFLGKMYGCDGDEKEVSSYLNISTISAKYPGPLLLSDDLSIIHKNTICDLFKSSGHQSLEGSKHPPIVIPPGAVARFNLQIRAPDKNDLKKDVTPFLSTGLVLSTDHGQIMPIIVAFEALLGHLKLFQSKNATKAKRTWQLEEGFHHQYDGEVVEVPLRLFPEKEQSHVNDVPTKIDISPSRELPMASNLTTWMYPIGASSVPIFLSSSFSKNITLRRIESCNPWFYVELINKQEETPIDNDQNATTKKVEIGRLHTAVTCPTMHNLRDSYAQIETTEKSFNYPSFYQCALEWLENRTSLQSYGCGVQPMPKSLEDMNFGTADDAIERALQALKNAIEFSMLKYTNGRFKYKEKEGTHDNRKNIGKGRENSDQFSNSFDSSTKSGAARGSALVDSSTLNVYSEVTDAWRIISELDLHSITSNFKATIEYSSETANETRKQNESTHEDKQNLTVKMRDIALRTKLAMPNLVKPQTHYLYKDRHDNEEDFFSILEFPPTAVADIVSVKVPMKNPTGVPVKVKLATVSWEEIRNQNRKDPFYTPFTDEVREKFLHQFESVYTQTGFKTSEKSPGDSWWEGHGTYHQTDDQGHLIQSRHNITVKAGVRSHVSMLNPSLSSQSAFTVGCGSRCGLREEVLHENKFEAGLRMTSTIGASAAAGASLVGRPRTMRGNHQFSDDEPTLSAGGTTFVDAAPAAFAVPYSAFDEIVIPPFGEGEIGPILFRPTGRYGLMGCDTILDNDAIPWGEKVSETCSSTIFQSMVLLENSLTGLERLLLRGKGMWESVVFLDPLSSDSFDAYGDLEIRDGYSTLMFPGSCVASQRTGVHPVTKGVIVQNDGDLDVTFNRVFLKDSTRLGEKKHKKDSSTGGCYHRGFRLLECSESDGANFTSQDGDDGSSNIYHGFSIPAGSNKTIFIEHHPTCTFRSEFVVITFEFGRNSQRENLDSSSHGFLSSNGMIFRRRENRADVLKRRNLELQVGFDMSSDDLIACIPVHSANADPAYLSGSSSILSWNKSPSLNPAELLSLQRAVSIGKALRKHFHGTVQPSYLSNEMVLSISSVSIAAFLCLIIAILISIRLNFSRKFKISIKKSKTIADLDKKKAQEGFIAQQSWSSTFRCLAREDPIPSELLSLGREQTKQILLHRSKTLGALSPQCIDSTGAFIRQGSTSNQRNNITSTGKLRTLSDSLFQRCHLNDSYNMHDSLMPCGLCWRTAAAHGLIGENDFSFKLKSDAILSTRDSASEKSKESNLDDPIQNITEQSVLAKDINDSKHVTILETNDKPTNDVVSTSGSEAQSTVEDGWQIAVTNNSSSSGRVKESSSEKKIDSNSTFTLQKQKKARRKAGDTNVERQKVVLSTEKKKPNRNKSFRPPTVSRAKSDDTNSTESSSAVANKHQARKKMSNTIQGLDRKELPLNWTKQNGKLVNRSKGKNLEELSPSLQEKTPSVAFASNLEKPKIGAKSLVPRKETQSIRPPPGLAPPPGFSGLGNSKHTPSKLISSEISMPEEVTDTAEQEKCKLLLPPLDSPSQTHLQSDYNAEMALNQLLSTTTSSPSNSTNRNSLFDTIRYTDEETLEISKSAQLRNDSSSSVETSQLNNNSDGAFDVMGFLDNLLDGRRIDSVEQSRKALQKDELSWSISSDPWAQPGRSRAAAYGIHVEGTKEETEDNSNIVQGILDSKSFHNEETSKTVVPLLNIAPSVNEKANENDSERNNSQEYDSEDFYTRLLGE